ncbi:MAG: D-alanyl-D-alanine carboxypeptidase/D-alanyl-D-alanine-endopeptidase [Bacteroidaceae bacterium]|nr:D-alanyl-D-alanine carboxypeptidase/D-alanyl-D-alanine-endopeptidase [Bacteroidaceae bacterium]
MNRNLFLLTALLLLSLTTSAQQVIDIDEVTLTRDSLSDDNAALADSTLTVDTLHTTHAQVLASRVRSLLRDKLFSQTQVGICIYDLTDDSLIYAYHPEYRLRPASNAKIITAVTALDLLGCGYTYHTSLLTDYEPDTLYVRLDDNLFQERIYLSGNVYVHGGFDPLFGSEDLDAFISSLKRRGITEIRGNIILDTSMKDENRLGWGWCWDDDDAPIVSLLYNGTDDFANALYTSLHTAGIKFNGQMMSGLTPDAALLLCEKTRPIADVLQLMMKQSNNLYAESMFYQLAAQMRPRGGGRKEAAAVIDSLVARLGLDYTIYEFADGSGLSLYNYATPQLLIRLLRYAYQKPDIREALIPSLPIAAVDGTLKSRMKNTPAANNVYAKTGTVAGVSTLSGYCTASNGHVIAFSIMNNGLRNASAGRAFQDRVCIALCK